MSVSQRWKGNFSESSVSDWWNGLFRDHEIFIRTAGQVRFLRLAASTQRRAATVAIAVLVAWAAITVSLLGWQAWTSWKTRDVAARAVALDHAAARIAAERQSVEQIAETLDARQDSIEALFKAHFGEDPDGEPPHNPPEPQAESSKPASEASAEAPVSVTSNAQAAVSTASPAQAAIPATDPVRRMQSMEVRQDRLVRSMTDAVAQRVARAEAALRTVGLKPAANRGVGGPFLPSGNLRRDKISDPALRRLATKLERMEHLEALLVAIPSDLPTEGMELSSGFGFRSDPFNGQRALHSGLDFRGAHRTPIRTAAAGRVSFAGVMNGYGNVIDIDHGHGMMTRYAHLAAFDVRTGDTVEAGRQIGQMGSTGRSTGTHLHFEVRINGVAVNPRRFLEVNADVLEVKADAGSRVRGLESAS